MKKISTALLLATVFLPMLAGATTLSCPDISNNLGAGITDSNTKGEVTALQQFLKDKGYFNTDPTGNFGPITETAVKKFQKANGIYDNGFVGPITRAKIRKISGCSAGGGTPPPSPPPPPVASGPTWGICTNPPAVDPGPPPATCFGRSVNYYDVKIASNGHYINWPAFDGTLGHISPYHTNSITILRFKTDQAGYALTLTVAWDGGAGVPTESFFSPTPCDYTWAYDNGFRIGTSAYGWVVNDIPVLAENQVAPYFSTAASYMSHKRYLKPNTYYYFHILDVDAANITNNAELTAAPDPCEVWRKGEVGQPYLGLGCKYIYLQGWNLWWPFNLGAPASPDGFVGHAAVDPLGGGTSTPTPMPWPTGGACVTAGSGTLPPGTTPPPPTPPPIVDNSTCTLPNGTTLSAAGSKDVGLWYSVNGTCYISPFFCRSGSLTLGVQTSPPPPAYSGGALFMDQASCH